MSWLALALFFALAAIADTLTLAWHSAREKRALASLVVLSISLETLTWVPVWFALSAEDWRIAVVSIAGSAVGTAVGMVRHTPDETAP